MSLLARGLAEAELSLRAVGLTGAVAFDALVEAVGARLQGRGPEGVHEVAWREAQRLPLDEEQDLLGLAFERFFPDLFKGRHGQFFTPPALVQLLLARLPAELGTVLDPTCGSAGLLVAAGRAGWAVRGVELNPRLARLAQLNLQLAGLEGVVLHADAFLHRCEPVDLVLANPPFSVPITDPEALERAGLDGERSLSDRVFLRCLPGWVKPGGWAALVLPWTVIANPSFAEDRERLLRDFALRGVCRLPEGIFRPFGGAAGRAGLVWLQRRPCDATGTWFSALDDPGYDVRSTALRSTSTEELEARCRGEGWRLLGVDQWLPDSAEQQGIPLKTLATLERTAVRVASLSAEAVGLIELADVDKQTGEVLAPRSVPPGAIKGSKAVLEAGDVLFSRLRPELNTVAVVPEADEPLLGSTEWVALRGVEHPHALARLLRTPSFLASLPDTGGQTRPRLSAETVGEQRLRIPEEPVMAQLDGLARRLVEARARLRERLLALEALTAAYADGQLDDRALQARLDELEEEPWP